MTAIKGYLNSIDLTRISYNSLSGLIVMAAAILIAEAFSDNVLIADIFSDAPTATVATLAILVGSAASGLLVSSLFHTFGRFIARCCWKPMKNEFIYRNTLMQAFGFKLTHFEWFYITGDIKRGVEVPDEKKAQTMLHLDDQAKLIRLIDLSGSSAWAMFLLGPAAAFFLFAEKGQPAVVYWLVALFIALVGIVLLFVSFKSLTKYERRKTIITLDRIRKGKPIA